MPVTEGGLEPSATPMTPYRERGRQQNQVETGFSNNNKKEHVERAVETNRLFATIGINERLWLHFATYHPIHEGALART